MLENVIIAASVLLNFVLGFFVYWFWKDRKDAELTIGFFVQKINQLADITASNASKTKLSLALRFEDLQTVIATVYADCIMYMKMKSKFTNNHKRYEQAPTKTAGNSREIQSSTGRDRGTIGRV